MGNTKSESELPSVTCNMIKSAINGYTSRFSRLESKVLYNRYQWIKHNYEEDSNCTYISARVKTDIKIMTKIGTYEGSVYGFLLSASELQYPFVIMSCNNNSYHKSINAILEYRSTIRSTEDERSLMLEIRPEILFIMIEDKEMKINWVYEAKFTSKPND